MYKNKSPAAREPLCEADLERGRGVGAKSRVARDVLPVERETGHHRAIVARELRLRHEKRHMCRGANFSQDGANAAVERHAAAEDKSPVGATTQRGASAVGNRLDDCLLVGRDDMRDFGRDIIAAKVLCPFLRLEKRRQLIEYCGHSNSQVNACKRVTVQIEKRE